MDAVYLALIVAIPSLIATILPLLLMQATNRNRRQEKIEDYARQDLVAERLIETNARVSLEAKAANSKLDVIHGLVNSNLTAALQETLDARREGLVLLNEFVEFKKSTGLEPTREAIEALGAARARIQKLESTLGERLKQSKEIERIQNEKMITALKKDVP